MNNFTDFPDGNIASIRVLFSFMHVALAVIGQLDKFSFA